MFSFPLLVSLIILTACSNFIRGNYKQNANGYVIYDSYIAQYNTNDSGEIDLLILDSLISYIDAIKENYFNLDGLLETDAINYYTEEELYVCGITEEVVVPRFILLNDTRYVLQIKDNSQCSFDSYKLDLIQEDPLVLQGQTLTNHIDFTINPFSEILYIEIIHVNDENEVIGQDIFQPLPMSVRQVGNHLKETQSVINQFQVLEEYVLMNQSINLLELNEDFDSEDVFQIWSEDTVETLGRNHDIIRLVQFKIADEILSIIELVMERVGMFR